MSLSFKGRDQWLHEKKNLDSTAKCWGVLTSQLCKTYTITEAYYVTNINTCPDMISDLTKLNNLVLYIICTWHKLCPGQNWVGTPATYITKQELSDTQSLSINRWLMYVQQCRGQIRLGPLSFPISPALLPVLSTGIELAVFTRRSCWNLTILTGCYLSTDLSFKCHCL